MIDEWRDNEYGTTCGYRRSTGMRDSVLGKKERRKHRRAKMTGYVMASGINPAGWGW
jgi:hypothetical protein